ncbi:uncharacterized protein LOC26530255 isoform X1 [Drosophila willistoni]|uniref:uncharacterized protein LOC26530255 isoform X1 n=1 Tax=Drosophila willistoni TaxID=7260 RepID=UPI000C26CE32|nr:uncharacterized protein LOC26530255 isoform X1 [Drosophila willistoni]
MMLRNLCCCSLRYSCMIIAITTICFYLIEMIAHGDDTVFMHEHEEVRKRWTLFLQSFILSIGIIVSLLLYYGSYKTIISHTVDSGICNHFYYLLSVGDSRDYQTITKCLDNCLTICGFSHNAVFSVGRVFVLQRTRLRSRQSTCMNIKFCNQ